MKTIFFCGHKSRYGLAHLSLFLRSKLSVTLVVLATDKRWNLFHESLTGESNHTSKNFKLINSIREGTLRKLILRIKYGRNNFKTIIKNLKEFQVPYLLCDDTNSPEFIKKIRDLQPDLILSAAYPQIFSRELITIPQKGAINCHPSLLPKFRGAHPHYWTIVKGESESGLTAHIMTERLDDGDIVSQIRFPVENFYYDQLYERIIQESPRLVQDIEDYFLNGGKKLIKQDSTKATYFRNDRAIHHRIFWEINSDKDIYNLIRGGNAFCFFRCQKVIIIKAEIAINNRNLTNGIQVPPGIIIDIHSDYLAIKSKEGCINAREFIINSMKFNPTSFQKKYRLQIGERFE